MVVLDQNMSQFTIAQPVHILTMAKLIMEFQVWALGIQNQVVLRNIKCIQKKLVFFELQ